MKAKKILFLDFDDVLNTSRTLERGELFEFANVQALNKILGGTDARIVVTSMWRIGASSQELEELLIGAGGQVVGRVIGTTPCLEDSPRGEEIQAWLQEFPLPVSDFAILDNRSDMEPCMTHLVQTDPQSGLVAELVPEVLGLLEKSGRIFDNPQNGNIIPI